MPKAKLFDEESADEEVSFETQNEYAKKYDQWREKEEIHKLEQKYGPKALQSDASLSSDSEDESDAPLEESEAIDAQFLKTLALLKTKDPRIYNPEYKFFNEAEQKEEEKPDKPKTLTFEDSDEDDDDGEIFTVEKKAEEMIQTDKKVEQKNNKKGKLKEYLTGKTDHIDDPVEKDLAPLKALWSDPKISDGEAFLRDYILNKRYLDEGEEIDETKVRDDEDLEADNETVEQQGKFERAYNFRFEEPDEEYLKRFPRTMNYIRPKDDKRSRKRAEVRSRKEDDKRRKMDEIGRLKALKLKEIQEKIAKIKEVTGNDELAFEEADIEGDFDPEEHDKRMRALFDKQFYGEQDDQKPVFPDLDEELEIENWDKYEKEENDIREGNEAHCEDEDFNMDADYDPKAARANLLEELTSNMGKKRRDRKKKSKLAQLLSEEKPKFIPSLAEKTYSEYMEEYYRMDCEDLVGDLPTRFKYREVVPNSYGLTVEEILLADDKELTQWVPLKKIVKHRPSSHEQAEVGLYARKAEDHTLKRKVLPSLYQDLPEEPEIAVPLEEATKKKKKKKKNKTKDNHNTTNDIKDNETNVEEQLESNEADEPCIVNSEVKLKKKHKVNNEGTDNIDKTNEDITEVNVEHNKTVNNATNSIVPVIDTKKRKKKSKKQKATDTDNLNSAHSKNDKQNTNGFLVENTHNEEPSQKGSEVSNKTKKRKLDSNDTRAPNKKKFKSNQNKDKNKQFRNKQKHTNDNPLSKLSDERLKAYGLKPKKYRSFLKYKKF